MGHYIRFIHNRDLAAENIVTACVRTRFIMSAPPEAIMGLRGRLAALGIRLPPNSILCPVDGVSFYNIVYIWLTFQHIVNIMYTFAHVVHILCLLYTLLLGIVGTWSCRRTRYVRSFYQDE